MRRRRRALGLVGVLVFAIVVLALAFVGGDGEPRRAPLLPTTTRPDLGGVEIRAVDGTTTTAEIAVDGDVVFTGVVRDGDGEPVPGSVVRAEWLRVDPPHVIEVSTDEGGRYLIEGVGGGRWLIRAWRTPDHATAAVEQVFVAHDEVRELDLRVELVPELSVTWAVEPDPPIIEHNATLVVVFVEQTVDLEGRAISVPVDGLLVTFDAPTAWQRVRGDESEVTDDDGRVEWVIRCGRSGRHPITLETFLGEEVLDLPACIPLSATTTTTTELPPDAEGGGGAGDGD